MQLAHSITSMGRIITCRRNEFKPFLPQTDVMHQSVYELVHTEDQQELRRNLHWALNPPATASTSSPDSPQGDSLSSFVCYYGNYGSSFRPFTNEMKENKRSVLFHGLVTESRLIYCYGANLLIYPGPSSTEFIFSPALSTFCEFYLHKCRPRSSFFNCFYIFCSITSA